MGKRTNIGSRLHSVERGNVVAGANEILDDAKGKKQNVINNDVDAELVRLDQSKQDNLTFDNQPTEGSDNPVKSGGVYAADKALSDAIEAILILIPSAATALNQLADKNFVNSSIATDTATFRGTSETGLSEAQFIEWANSLTHDMNDYVFWQTIDEAGNTLFKRYKWNGTQWLYEYTLNNSSFTADQWAAIMSGITSALVEKLNGLPTNAALQQALNSKQDALTFDNVPTENSTNPVKSGGVYSAVKTEEDARLNLAQTVSEIGGDVSQIEDVIPAGATGMNKLVENASMEAYVASIIQNITSSFTLSTADGHINITLTQVNGQVATLTLSSSDIASAQALTALTGRVTTAEGNITSLTGRVSTNETDIANLQQLYNDLQQSKPVPVTALPETGQQQGVIYRLAGTTSYSDYMWNGSMWVLMATYNNAVDPRPKKASKNLVTSGGVFDNMGALDVSELNATENPHTLAQYVDLSAALAAVPTDYQKGGMSIKYVQSSDNKYVQYMLTNQTWSTTESDWEKLNLEEEVSQLGQEVMISSSALIKTQVIIGGNAKYQSIDNTFSDIILRVTANASLSRLRIRLTTSQNTETITRSIFNDAVVEGETYDIPVILADNEHNIYYYVAEPNVLNLDTIIYQANLAKPLFDNSIPKLGLPEQMDDTPTTGSNNFVKSGGVKTAIGDAVDDERQRAVAAENALGTWGENDDYLEAKTDSENKIIEAVDKDGFHHFLKGQVVSRMARTERISHPDYLDVTVDKNGRIIEGVTVEGHKHISKFDRETENTIRKVVGGGSLIQIPVLNETFGCPIPYKVFNGALEDDSVKGTPSAKYIFTLPIGDTWLVRFKFRVTENILNAGSNKVIASINGAQVLARIFPLSQHEESRTYEEEEYLDKFPTYDGGITYNKDEHESIVDPRNIGGQAFSVRYVGSGDEVTLENNGTALILTVDGVDTSYTLSDYESVDELYAALLLNSDLELQYIALDQRTCDELAVFEPIVIKGTIHSGINGSDETYEYVDNPPLYLYYAIDEKWHQVEIFKINGNIIACCDGNTEVVSDVINGNELVLGGECGVLFKDFVCCPDGTLDAEYINDVVVSSVTPHIVVFECHGMYDGPTYTLTMEASEHGMSSLNPDAMEYFYTILDNKGYLPVSIEDVAEFYTCGKTLPKRCYVHIFDDYRFNICMNNNFRRVYSRHGAKPALAVVTNRTQTITHNGVEITQEEATKICRTAGFSLVSHFASHITQHRYKPSEYASQIQNCIYSADVKSINGSVIVYPGGQTDTYYHDVLDFMGVKLGVEIYNKDEINNIAHNRFMISRVNIGRIMTRDGQIFDNYDSYISKLI